MEITLTLDSRMLDEYLRVVKRRLGNLRPFFLTVIPVLHRSIIANFRVGGRPRRWAPLSLSWKERRRREGTLGGGPFGQPILQRFGTLRQSIGTVNRMTNDGLEYGTNLRKAPTLQFGRGPMSGVANVKSHWRFVQGRGTAFGRTARTRAARGAARARFRAGARHVRVRGHRRRFHFGPIPARPFILFQDEDVRRILHMAAAFAFDPERAGGLVGRG